MSKLNERGIQPIRVSVLRGAKNRRVVYRGDVYNAIEGERINTLPKVLGDAYWDGYHDGLKRALFVLNTVKDVDEKEEIR